MQKYGIPTAQYKVFNTSNLNEIEEFIKKINYPIVIKADGLAAGKGVIICNNDDETGECIKDLTENKIFGDAGLSFVVEQFLTGNEVSLFVITDGENYTILPSAQDYKRIFEEDKGKNTGGITGPPGAGKSTLTNALVKLLIAHGYKVGVIAIDPTSPFTGGALLGDRIRMTDVGMLDGVYIRSMATRGSLGGLSMNVVEACDVLDACGKDFILIETVGVGQSELDIAKTADSTIVVLVPESGDAIQAMKAGLMEIADIFVLNKSDREGADGVAATLKNIIHLKPPTEDNWTINVLKTVGINGQEITYQQFEQAVEQQAAQMRQQSNGKDIDDAQMQQIRDQVWNGLITQTITKEAMQKYNVTVSDKEILDWIYNRPEQLPDPIKKNFMDSTGVFNVASYQQALGMKTKEATQFWTQVETYLREVLQSEKLQSVLTAGVRITEADVLQKYKDDKITANISFTALDQGMVTDTNLNNPSNDELKKYYDDHKDDFKVDESVKFKYVVFSDAATAEDTSATQKLLEVLIKDFKTSAIEDSSLIRLVNDNSATPYSDAFQKPNALGADATKFLFTAKPGDVSGVLVGNDGYKVLRLIDSKEGDDLYVNASHILVNFGTDTVAAKKKAEDIFKRVKAGEDINTLAQQLSDEPSAKTVKGDLGWFTKGAMVKEFEDAAFNAKDGEIVGPVKTQFGFHIIQVKGKSKKEFKVAEIKKAVTAGARTKDIAKKKAESFYLDVDKGGNIDTLAKQLTLTCTTTPDILKDGFIPGAGQNKKLMKLALDSKKGKVFEPLKIQGGFGVYELIDKTPAGYRNFDSIKTIMVKPKVVEKKKFAVLKQMATDLRAKIQNNDIKTLGNLTPPSVVETADSVSVSKPAPKIGQDYAVTDAIFSMKQGEISQPIRGVKGYYLIQNNGDAQLFQKLEMAKIYVFYFDTYNSKTVENAVKDFAAESEVDYSEPAFVGESAGKREFNLSFIPNDEMFSKQWYLNNEGQIAPTGKGNAKIGADINMINAWDIEKGSESVIVAILDSGVKDDHPDLRNRMWINKEEIPDNGIDDDGNGYVDDYKGWDFAYDDNMPTDGFGHGTNIASVIGCSTNNVIGFAVAPGNKIYGLDYENNTGYESMWSGTSQSTAIVSGIASLLLSQKSSRSMDDLKNIITSTAKDQVGDPREDRQGWDKYYGYGRVDCFAALTYGYTPVVTKKKEDEVKVTEDENLSNGKKYTEPLEHKAKKVQKKDEDDVKESNADTPAPSRGK
ncbi:unnamed protein product [Rotaria sp. Silwood1]|nr:unnamed protein product [Rotaria sp. Silwood1]CAF4638144.1 unnamed protein product [Rotaria sp. Silwood1]